MDDAKACDDAIKTLTVDTLSDEDIAVLSKLEETHPNIKRFLTMARMHLCNLLYTDNAITEWSDADPAACIEFLNSTTEEQFKQYHAIHSDRARCQEMAARRYE